jgi:hypothetical protein
MQQILHIIQTAGKAKSFENHFSDMQYAWVPVVLTRCAPIVIKKALFASPPSPCSLPSYILAAFAYIRQLPASLLSVYLCIASHSTEQAGKKVGLKIVEYASPEAEFMNAQFC